MTKPVFGLVLGGILGIFDGLTALVSAPETAPGIAGIVIGSTIKGVIAGVLIGYFARKVNSLPLGILFGLAVGAFLAFLVARMQGKYYLEIMLPGSLVGVIVGYATQRHREAARAAAAVLLLLLAAPALHAAGAAGIDAKAAFQELKGLAGEWQGNAMNVDGPPVRVVYSVASNGNVVMEDLFPGSTHEMITMYYLEGDQLHATHYCALGNRPQFKLDTAASQPGDLVFAFDGGGGFDPVKDMHIHSGRIHQQGERLQNDWVLWAGGKAAGTNQFFLTRASAQGK
jgi:hypothetical protein